MVKFKNKFKHVGGNDTSDSVSELSHDDSSVGSSPSMSSAFRSKFAPSRFGKKKKADTAGTRSVGSEPNSISGASLPTSSASANGTGAKSPPQSQASPTSKGDASSVPARERPAPKPVDNKRLQKDAKSRFNIGLVYLKTGDYSKAQENLEHSLYCHIQLAGHDHKLYTNEALFGIASVREKLGDCYFNNEAIADKGMALDHYEEAQRLLKTVHPEDAPDNVTEMLNRVNEKLEAPELRKVHDEARELHELSGGHLVPGREHNRSYDRGDNTNYAVGAAAVGGVAVGATAAAAAPSGSPSGSLAEPGNFFGKVTGKINKIKAKIEDEFDDAENKIKSSHAHHIHHHQDPNLVFDIAMGHLERDNHRTALNHLSSLQTNGAMTNEIFRTSMVEYMMKVGDSAFESAKICVATDAYEGAFAIRRQEEYGGRILELALRGCVKGHKQLAMEEEKKEDYDAAIQHRNRLYQLLDMNNRAIPACQQLVVVAFLHGQMQQFERSEETLSDAIKRLFKGVQSFDLMPKDRIPLLIRCYHMRAICYSKLKKWNKAFEQYDEVLPLIARQDGVKSQTYNSALIHKAALLATTGDHTMANNVLTQYFKNARDLDDGLLVDEADHILALDTRAAAYLHVGSVENAIIVFEQKLAFAKTHPANDEMQSETMHNLGCLLAHEKRHDEALPLLTSALDTRKYIYDGKSKFLFESSWAVAATSQNLGENDKALKEYILLLEKVNKVEDSPINVGTIHNSAGKLFFEDGQIDKAVKSFQSALKWAETSGSSKFKIDTKLNLANSISAKGDIDRALKIYDDILRTSQKDSAEYFLTLYNKSLALITIGEVEEAKEILDKVLDSRLASTKDLKGSLYLTRGKIAISEGDTTAALEYFEKSLGKLEGEESNLTKVSQVKKSMAMVYADLGEYDTAIVTLENMLEDLSKPGIHGKTADILKADTWSYMGRVYQKKDDMSSAKNFSKLGKTIQTLHLE